MACARWPPAAPRWTNWPGGRRTTRPMPDFIWHAATAGGPVEQGRPSAPTTPGPPRPRPDFICHAATAGGQVEQGRLSAANAALALKQLRAQGLTPLHLADASAAAAGAADPGPMPGGFAQPRQRQSKGPVRAADILALTSELAIMLRAGLALDNALRVLIDMSHKPSVAALVQALLDAVKGGTPLSRALAAHGPLFGDFYINMVRSGEASGQMSAVLDRLV